jgi:23S rRNA (adenine2503-C2)-methyltransferase
MQSIKSVFDPENHLSENLAQQGFETFRYKQIRRWLYQGRVSSFEDMSNLPKKLRIYLNEHFRLRTTRTIKHQTADDGTEKLLLELPDGGQIECVLLKDGIRRTICVSSQVGCAMGCVFCASGLDGVDRNLTAGEILEQMVLLQSLLPEMERLSHIVMMGMGEPLANIANVLKALEIASCPEGLGISPRRITISTVGIPQAIDKLSSTDCRFNLAVSLHAPNDELRDKLVPVNKKIGIKSVLDAADRYFEASGRRLTFEYVLLSGINDQVEHAEELKKLLAPRNVLLNVIPYNPVDGLPYRTPSTEAISRFRQILENAGIKIKFRQRKGDKIKAACGQLRRIVKIGFSDTNSL